MEIYGENLQEWNRVDLFGLHFAIELHEGVGQIKIANNWK